MKTIYAIKCNNTGYVKYVGITVNLRNRISTHENRAHTAQRHKKALSEAQKPIYTWMRKVGKSGYHFAVLSEVDNKKAIATEVFYSELYRDTILNMCIGNETSEDSGKQKVHIYQYSIEGDLVATYESTLQASRTTG